MAERLVILSDMWGSKKGLWITSYLGYLQQYFDIVFYDCQQLANITLPVDSYDNVCNEFINGGLDTAVTHLLRRETVPSHYLAFCAGGTIAWRAHLKGLPMKSLFAVSAGRIDVENLKPNCPVSLLFGAYDAYVPSNEWITRLGIDVEVVPGFGHELYTDEKIIKKVCQNLLGAVIQKQYQV
ncbi:hypothetical protein U1E44_01300 [Arenibacter sp. GZD96]|uniref:hypothetical protein n=1 Tax=Aurantibrevibacter litoralis TaxID=3106030 RepID=UPI002AFF2632|nr:hypothetical protein [Arenibacter sp. GZD-96]MEA1784716.1 hypothetical protein [Arenibacter sp. GZD-96]